MPAMAEIDLTDPQQLAELLQATLPGFADEKPERVAHHVGVLEASDAEVFAHVGSGHKIDDHAPVEQQPPVEQQVADQVPLEPPAQQVEQAQQIAQEPLPLDLGGEGELIEDLPHQVSETGGVPVRARRGWNEFDRHRAKGRHEVYTLAATHTRARPVKSEFTGRCQAVRVRLPATKPSADAFIGTWVGVVEAKDHLVFSVAEIEDIYARSFGERVELARVDLITGARFRGRRFSPVSVLLAYDADAPGAKPLFYLLEGGSASGNPEALYCAQRMGAEIHTKADFKFTPFACHDNWYNGGLAMSEDLSEPACVYLDIAQNKAGEREYLRLSVTYALDTELDKVVHPFELQIEAAMRVMAIADEMGCQLRTGSGGVLQHSLGPIARALMPWDEKPNGTTTPAERETYCGCPKG